MNDYGDLKKEIIAFFSEYTMPLLENLKCEKDYLTLFENKNPQIIWDNNQFLYVASAYVNEQKIEEAKQVIEKRFGKPGLRKQYADAFSFIENL